MNYFHVPYVPWTASCVRTGVLYGLGPLEYIDVFQATRIVLGKL